MSDSEAPKPPAADPLSFQFAAGVVSGLAVVIVGNPFDTVKTRMQIDGAAGVRKYTGPLDAFKSIVQKEGPLALYKGVRAPLVATPFVYMFSFGTWGVAEHFLTKWGYTEPKTGFPGEQQLTVPGLFITGAFSGLCQSVVFVPSELVKKRLMAQDHGTAEAGAARYKGIIDCTRQIYREHGLKKFYVGFPMVLSAYVPACALWYGAYGYFRRKFNKDPLRPSALATIAAGGLAGWTAWGLMFPFDTIGARLQTAEHGKYKGGVDCIKQLYASEGMAGFYKGFVPCMLRAFPADGALFLAYELAMRGMRYLAGMQPAAGGH